MSLAVFVSLFMEDGVALEITYSALIVVFLGGSMILISRKKESQIQKREGYLIVTFGWLLMALTGMLPFLFTGSVN